MSTGRQFTSGEAFDIREMYRDAKHPDAQIGVLAQLYACGKKDIRRVLELSPGAENAAAKRYRYPMETIEAVVSAVLNGGVAIKTIAERYGISTPTIRRWVADEKERQAAGEIPMPEPPPEKQTTVPPMKSIRFIMKSGAVFDVRCGGLKVIKDKEGKFQRYWFEQPEGLPPIYICHYDVAAILELQQVEEVTK